MLLVFMKSVTIQWGESTVRSSARGRRGQCPSKLNMSTDKQLMSARFCRQQARDRTTELTASRAASTQSPSRNQQGPRELPWILGCVMLIRPLCEWSLSDR
jgi:hypothetical protein